jgi:Methyltransferase domain
MGGSRCVLASPRVGCRDDASGRQPSYLRPEYLEPVEAYAPGRMSPLKARVLHTLANASPRAANLAAIKGPLRDVLPPDLGGLDRRAWLPQTEVGHAGLDLRVEDQLRRLKRWGNDYTDLFSALRADEAINPWFTGQPRIHNGQFPTPDAEVYASIIGDYRPSRIVEVGAGFSTLIARRAMGELGHEAPIVAIDPEPRTDVLPRVSRLIQRPVELVSPSDLALESGDVLFIDSSHVVRARGDVPHLFNSVIPELPGGTLVHVHDVFIPFDYPDAYRLRLYSEQYVLHALLSSSPRYRVLFTTHWMARQALREMRAALGPGVGHDERFFGASMWFEVADDVVSSCGSSSASE